jgi:bifunctional DNA-binding transcriptional regulator/antitoxin component of YhaV-PrlF toxin-antitoxin module
MTTTLSPEWQITIPPQIRKRISWPVGASVSFTCVGHNRVELSVSPKSIACLKGIVPQPANPVTLGEMDKAIAEGASDDWH